jgi:hypothetical protein
VRRSERDSQTHRDPEVQEVQSLRKAGQASVRWRIGNVVHAFIVASVLSSVDLGLGGSAKAGKLDVYTTYGGEIDPACDQNRCLTGCRVGGNDKTQTAKSEGPVRHQGAWHESNLQCLNGDARWAHSDETSLEPSGRLRTLPE